MITAHKRLGYGGRGPIGATGPTPGIPGVNGFRLTALSGVAVPTTDQAAAGNLYLTPFTSNRIGLYASASWAEYTSAEITLPLSGLTAGKNYDVFAYAVGSVVTLETLVWTNDTTRATSCTRQDGVWCKTGDPTRRLIGTFRASAAATTEDTKGQRWVSNASNRVSRYMEALDTTDSWTYTLTTWRQARASASNQLDFVESLPQPDQMTEAHLTVYVYSDVGGPMSAGIGVDSTSVNSAQLHGTGTGPVTGVSALADYKGIIATGRHYIAWLESSQALGTTTWFGDAGSAFYASGILGKVWG